MTVSIGSLYPTEIPSLSETADIQEAFRLYHYGDLTYDINNTDPENIPNPSVAYSFHNIQTQIDTLTSTPSIPVSAFTVKGSLLVGTGSSTYVQLTPGSDGFILTANSAATNGIEWALPSVTPTNTVSLTNKTLTSPNIETPVTKIGFNAQSVTTYSLTLSDRDKLVTFNNASPTLVTIPSGVFSAGEFVNIQQISTGQVTIQGDQNATFTGTGTKLRTRYSAATIICIGVNTFTVLGDLV